MTTVTALPSLSVRASNTDTQSDNGIHRDEVARKLGYTWGLVPGVVTYEFLCRPAVVAWGTDWLSRGQVRVQLMKPVYDGQLLAIEASPVAETGQGLTAEIQATIDRHHIVATATVVLPPEPNDVPANHYEQVPAPLPQHRPEACPTAFAALDQLCSFERVFQLDDAMIYQERLGGDLDAYRELGVAGPGDLLRDANHLFEANVVMGPWMHVATAARYFDTVHDGDLLSTRGRVVDVYERNGNQYAVLDLLQVSNDDRPVAHYRHTVIWQLRQAG